MHIIQNLLQSTERHVKSGIDGKAEGLFSRQPETQLIQWWQVLWKGFHHFQHNNGIHSNIIKQVKIYWNFNLFILSSCYASTVFISGSREMIFSDFKQLNGYLGSFWGRNGKSDLAGEHNQYNFDDNITFYICEIANQ